MKNEKLSLRNWIGIILIGFVGQLAWAVENNYINLWVYSQSHDVNHITWMTIGSSIVAAITSFIMGTLSDRLGKRKIFIGGGYIIWGVTVFLFGVMSYHNINELFGPTNALLLVGIMNLLVDCFMTFFGSTANDACFNAYVTDVTNKKNRNLVESILSVMPLFALGAMLVIGGVIGVPGQTNSGESIADFSFRISSNWFIFFLIFGVLTTIVGIVTLFVLPKEEILPNKKSNYLNELIYGFKPSTIKANPGFYLTLIAFLFFNIAIDSFMPYYLVYFTNDVERGGLGLGDNYLTAMILIMGIASLLVIMIGANLNKIGPMKLLIPALVLLAIGAGGFLFVTDLPLIIIFGIIMIFGYLLGTTILGAKLRDETPKEEVGLFQGVRMAATVMIPMIVGSELGKLAFGGASYFDESTGSTVYMPTNMMFLVTAIAAIVAAIPSIILLIQNKKTPK